MEVQKLIAENDQRFIATFADQNAAGIAAFYLKDAVLLPPNTAALSGTEAIQGFWQQAFDNGIAAVTLKTLELDIFDNNNVCQYGRYGLYDADGNSLDEGKYLIIWKKAENAWLIQKDMWNSGM